MAKGKHAPAPGAVRKDKVIHPKSRKAVKLQTKALKEQKNATTVKAGGQRLVVLSEKLNWFKENLPILLGDDSDVTPDLMLTLAEAYLDRFQEEVEQIGLKNSIGGKNNKRQQHRSRLDTIEHTMKIEKEEFEGCGLEMPDLLDKENLQFFSRWTGEVRFVQKIKLRKFRRADLAGGSVEEEGDMDLAT